MRVGMEEAVKKLGVPGRNLSDKISKLGELGIDFDGIHIEKLRAALKVSLPPYLKLRDGEVKDRVNCMRAIIGRLAHPDVFEPFSLRLAMAREDLSVEEKIAIALAYLEEGGVNDKSVYVPVLSRLARWAYQDNAVREVLVVGVAEALFGNDVTNKGEFIQAVMDLIDVP